MIENFSIDFYSKTEAAVSTIWEQEYSPARIRYLDTLFFSCYLIRQMRNMGNHPANKALMHQIMMKTPPNLKYLDKVTGQVISHSSHIMFHAALAIDVELDRAYKKYGQPIYLVPYQGKGKKRFKGSMIFRKNRPLFFLHIDGFGIGALLGINIPFYATDSIFHIISYLCKKNSFNLQYIESLLEIAKGCVKAYQYKGITSLNQEIIAQGFVKKYLKASSFW